MLIDNVVLIQFLALCPFIGMTTDTGKAMGMGTTKKTRVANSNRF